MTHPTVAIAPAIAEHPPTRTIGGILYRHLAGGVYRDDADSLNIRSNVELDAMELQLTDEQAAWLLYAFAVARWWDIPPDLFMQLRQLGCIHPEQLRVTRLGRFWCDNNHLSTQLPAIPY